MNGNRTFTRVAGDTVERRTTNCPGRRWGTRWPSAEVSWS